MKKKVLLTGASGMLATDFLKYQGESFDIIACRREELDITSLEDIKKVLGEYKPHVVLNCAAYTAVDDAEDIGAKLNYDINTLGVSFLALACKEYGIDLITISTDYVFSGTQEVGYSEDNPTHPINSYGMAKYLGEKLAREIFSQTIIVRTSWLYGGAKNFKNFVNTMLRFAETRSELKVVDDQFGIPTSSRDLSLALCKLIDMIELSRGKIFHFSNTSLTPKVSWAEFAREIMTITGKSTSILPCSSLEYPTKAQRPHYSMLRNHSQIQLPDWREGLKSYLDDIA